MTDDKAPNYADLDPKIRREVARAVTLAAFDAVLREPKMVEMLERLTPEERRRFHDAYAVIVEEVATCDLEAVVPKQTT